MTKEEGKKLADLRNKMGAIYTHFQLLEEKRKPGWNDNLERIFLDNERIAIESMNKVKKILDFFG